MTDWLSREKVAGLPKSISVKGAPVKPFEVGDVSYDAPRQSLVVFYTGEGSSSVSGLYSLGTIEWGSEFGENSGAPIRVRMDKLHIVQKRSGSYRLLYLRDEKDDRVTRL